MKIDNIIFDNLKIAENDILAYDNDVYQTKDLANDDGVSMKIESLRIYIEPYKKFLPKDVFYFNDCDFVDGNLILIHSNIIHNQKCTLSNFIFKISETNNRINGSDIKKQGRFLLDRKGLSITNEKGVIVMMFNYCPCCGVKMFNL